MNDKIKYFIHPDGTYGAFINAHPDSELFIEVPERPSISHKWDGTRWVAQTKDELDISWRATAKCSPMQGKLALGQANWAKIEAYRATATWAEQVVIDSAQEWRRNSQDIQFLGHLLGYTDEQMDNLFKIAMQIES